MGNLIRVDAELVRRNLARSRAQAAQLIQDGCVFLDGVKVTKAARQMSRASALLVKEAPQEEYASRGAYKLLGALGYLGAEAPQVSGVRALDAGASTGGFTDVLLRRGAQHVYAVDVGYGQILWRLREDERVTVIERTNVRTLDPKIVTPAPQLIVSDLSFISLTLVLPALVQCAAAQADFLLMVKPQFEVGKSQLGTGGVVRDPSLHFRAVAKVASAARESGLAIKAVAPSPLPGPAGNVEYFLHLQLADNKPEKTGALKGTLPQNPEGSIESNPDLASATEYLRQLGEKVSAQIAAAIYSGPAGKQLTQVSDLALPLELQAAVNAEITAHKQRMSNTAEATAIVAEYR
ncbi:23S rRNA (cytidine1920-2'-O)/16S rRNA (cytidine1409-2'-O)-methyltransferase [Arcanobacterium hippocoleae]|uniref:23S rRNA (Cytidine1920-2'-O)/16S rRNA (Cytidine1409-2'-O)-methyltransferase n=1 Tax=Arcanobacterium hippocoleae TaxID=149017 RepID=A0ABU1SZR8_9ACTO|nr:23S rRNA (cytidine1920-2'-O)/16S rRNA (cytidine1409-2'-O)-methyltransferase [Arcanobacterium hippocoleae]